MTDLFISYSSHDRPWAERLYNDLRRRFPTINIFWDRESIPPGASWSTALNENAEGAKHFVVFWSQKAKESDQVGPEIQSFRQNRALRPVCDGAQRTFFFIPLEGSYGSLEQEQAFTELRRFGCYSAADPDRGVAKLGAEPYRTEWNRLVGIIGETAIKAEVTQPVNLALLVMNRAIEKHVDPFLDLKDGPGPTLREVLDTLGLSLADAKSRYGDNASGWRPFGDQRTVVDLMQELRETMNGGLKEYSFHWEVHDLVEMVTGASDLSDLYRRIEALGERPTAIVADPISLFNPIVSRAFMRLDGLLKKDHSVFISLLPQSMPAVDRLYDCLRSNGDPVLGSYFLPQIPAAGGFALCGLNMSNIRHAERLMRGSLGLYHLRRKTEEAKRLTATGA